ncbi:MAG: zinc-binding dehydrogenase [Sedimentisphaerales bacterium]|nr:zinc-binding dehydrogenase [Sedimentisphaerales bacterium]
MKAVVIHEHGELDKLIVEEIPEPKYAEDEVLLKVRSAGLNHLDIWVRKGRGNLNLPKPHVLGSDASGVVIAAGANVKNVAVGDEVIVNPGLSCGCCEYCNRGEQSECVSFGILGLIRPGTFAEKVAVPSRNVWPKPSHMSFNEAGSFVLAYLTAWRMLVTRAQLKPGQTVLIHGIGGGVALSALQLAKLSGAQVIVTSSSDAKLQRAGLLGADHVINYKNVEDVAQKVKDITSGRGVDIAIDTVGAATWPIDFAAVRQGGKIVLCGVTSDAQAVTNLRTLYWNQLTILGSTMGSDEDLRQMLLAVNQAKLKPVIDSTLKLENIKEATNRMENAEQFGKIVLEINK